MAFGRRVLHPLSQHCLCRPREFINRVGARSAVHAFQDLKQAPPLALVTFRMQDALSLEIYVIDQGITSLRRFGETLELFLHVRSIRRRRFGKHFGQRAL